MAAANAEFLRAKADDCFNSLQQALPDMPADALAQRLAEFDLQRMDAVPDLTRYPELRGMRELVDAERRGVRDGAGLSPRQLSAYWNHRPFYFRFVMSGKLRAARAHCSYVYFPTSDHGPLLGFNLDTGLTEPFQQPDWPALNEHLLKGAVSSGVFLDEESPELFPVPVDRLVSRYCRSTDEAVEMYTRYNHFWGPCNTILIDRSGRVAMIEKTACRIAVRYSPDGFAFITAMVQDDPAMKAYHADRKAASLVARGLPTPCADTAYWAAQERRLAIMKELLEESRRHPTLQQLQRFVQFRDPERGNVAGNGEILFPGGLPSEHTVKTTIWLLTEGKAIWWSRDHQRGIPSWQNRMPDVTFRGVWSWS
jgi:hypothetical protein